MLEHPLPYNRRTTQNLPLFEVRGRRKVQVKRKRVREGQKCPPQEEEGSSLQPCPSELADGEEVRKLHFSEGFLSDSKVWLASVSL